MSKGRNCNPDLKVAYLWEMIFHCIKIYSHLILSCDLGYLREMVYFSLL